MNSDNASVLNVSGSLMSETYEGTSNPPGSMRSFSVYGDSACGEPLVAQRVVVDFTPSEEDTDFLQRKVCAFWEFVNVTPELQSLLVLPDTDLFKISESSDILPEVVKHHKKQYNIADNKALTKERTAVSMLEFVEGKGLIDCTFESRLPQSRCSLGSKQYHESDLPVDIENGLLHDMERNGNSYEGQVKYNKRTQTMNLHRTETTADVRDVCQSMRRWDEQHSKCVCRARDICTRTDARTNAPADAFTGADYSII